MENNHTASHPLMETAGKFAGHAAAVVLGLILIVIGLSLGVSMVALPIGVPVGLAGVLVFLWGLFGISKSKSSTPPQV